jgi:hypothetical protein
MRPRLFAFERAWTDAAFDAIHPNDGVLPHGVAIMHPARFLDEVVRETPLEQSMGIRLALWIVALAPLFTIRRLGTIASIAPADRARVLERLLASPIYAVRQLVLSLKAMAALLYAQSTSVRAAMTSPRFRSAAEADADIVTLRRSRRGGAAKAHEHDQHHAAE